jgi:hypothetical protein
MFTWLGCLLIALVIPGTVRADRTIRPITDLDSDPVLSVHGQEAMRNRLMPLVFLVEVQPNPGFLQDPSLVPVRIGQAVVVGSGNRVEILTSAALVEDAAAVHVQRFGSGTRTKARVTEVRETPGLAVLECEGGCVDRPPVVQVAPHESCRQGSRLFLVTPAGAHSPVMTWTQVTDSGERLDENLLLVAGRMSPGTPLFDDEARVAAIAIRSSPTRTEWTLASGLCLPSEKEEPALPTVSQ